MGDRHPNERALKTFASRTEFSFVLEGNEYIGLVDHFSTWLGKYHVNCHWRNGATKKYFVAREDLCLLLRDPDCAAVNSEWNAGFVSKRARKDVEMTADWNRMAMDCAPVVGSAGETTSQSFGKRPAPDSPTYSPPGSPRRGCADAAPEAAADWIEPGPWVPGASRHLQAGALFRGVGTNGAGDHAVGAGGEDAGLASSMGVQSPSLAFLLADLADAWAANLRGKESMRIAMRRLMAFRWPGS